MLLKEDFIKEITIEKWVLQLYKDGTVYAYTLYQRKRNHGYLLRPGMPLHYLPMYVAFAIKGLRQELNRAQ